MCNKSTDEGHYLLNDCFMILVRTYAGTSGFDKLSRRYCVSPIGIAFVILTLLCVIIAEISYIATSLAVSGS